MAKMEISLSLDQTQLDWLQRMAQKYSLPTADKALRIVILFAKKEKEPANSVFKEMNAPAPTTEVTGNHAVDKVHEDYLDTMVASFQLPSKDKVVQIILNYAMTHVDEKTLFEVKYCKHGDTCKHCK